MEWQKIFANDETVKVLISKTYKQLIQLNIKKQTTQSKMGRRPKQIFLQRRHTDGLQAYEKMFNIANYQRNANQNYNKVHPIPEWPPLKYLQTRNVGEDVEKREPLHTVGGNINWCNHYGDQCGCFLKNF